jgi:hypothetical protein
MHSLRHTRTLAAAPGKNNDYLPPAMQPAQDDAKPPQPWSFSGFRAAFAKKYAASAHAAARRIDKGIKFPFIAPQRKNIAQPIQ